MWERKGTVYAWLISLNFSAAWTSPWLRSGWCCIAIFRYATFISDSVALLCTPNTL